MQVSFTTSAPTDTHADTVAIGVLDGKGIAHDTPGGELQALLDAGEAKTSLQAPRGDTRRGQALDRGRTRRPRERFDAERARVIAALVSVRGTRAGHRGDLLGSCPTAPTTSSPAASSRGPCSRATGTTATRPATPTTATRSRSSAFSDHDDRAKAIGAASIVAHAANAARDLQNAPANDMTPEALAARAREVADSEQGVSCEVMGRDEIAAAMGMFSAVAQGTYAEPQLITLRYEGPDGTGPCSGSCKAVTFDSGGISLKPPRRR